MAKRAKTKEPKKRGPKPWMPTPRDIERARKASAKGLTFPAIASVLGISEDTLADRREKVPELSEAIREGRCRAIEEVESALFLNATTPHYIKGNLKDHGLPASQSLWLKNHAGYKENVAMSGPNGGPVPVQFFLPENGRGDAGPKGS